MKWVAGRSLDREGRGSRRIVNMSRIIRVIGAA